MALRNNVQSINKEEVATKAATIQPAALNGIRFRATNLYDNNPAHESVIKFARKKADELNTEVDEYGVKLVDVSGYEVRLHGFDKPKLNTDGFIDLV